MGRRGGIDGIRLRADADTGRWKTQIYEARKSPDFVAENWSPIGKFLELVLRKRPDV